MIARRGFTGMKRSFVIQNVLVTDAGKIAACIAAFHVDDPGNFCHALFRTPKTTHAQNDVIRRLEGCRGFFHCICSHNNNAQACCDGYSAFDFRAPSQIRDSKSRSRPVIPRIPYFFKKPCSLTLRRYRRMETIREAYIDLIHRHCVVCYLLFPASTMGQLIPRSILPMRRKSQPD